MIKIKPEKKGIYFLQIKIKTFLNNNCFVGTPIKNQSICMNNWSTRTAAKRSHSGDSIGRARGKGGGTCQLQGVGPTHLGHLKVNWKIKEWSINQSNQLTNQSSGHFWSDVHNCCDSPGPGVLVRMVSVAGSCMAVKAELGWVGPLDGAGPGLVRTAWPWGRTGDTPTLGRTNWPSDGAVETGNSMDEGSDLLASIDQITD